MDSSPHKETLATRLELVSDSATHIASAESAAAAVGLAAADRQRLLDNALETSRAVRDLANALSEPDDEEELYRVIAALWLQLRFEWQRHNDVMNYAAVVNSPLPAVAAEGCIGSALLEQLESLLLPEHLAAMSGYAIDLLKVIGRGQSESIDTPPLALVS
jgi:hypothetical protein